jgi:hypothetical protein
MLKTKWLTHPQARYCPFLDAAMEVPLTQPSSVNLFRHLLLLMSHIYTSPSSATSKSFSTYRYPCTALKVQYAELNLPFLFAKMLIVRLISVCDKTSSYHQGSGHLESKYIIFLNMTTNKSLNH